MSRLAKTLAIVIAGVVGLWFVILIVVLLIRPAGLLGRNVTEKV